MICRTPNGLVPGPSPEELEEIRKHEIEDGLPLPPQKNPEERLAAVEQEVEDLSYIITGKEVASNGK